MSAVIFFHIATIGKWKEIYNELINIIYNSGLINDIEKIYIGLVGEENLNIIHNKIEILYKSNINNFEFLTLEQLLIFSKMNPTYKILYIHTKGVSAALEYKEAIDDWRQYMSYFLIENYKMCLNKLENFDVCGVDWVDQPSKHFSGNFWWANAKYLNTLPVDWKDKNILTKRHNCEFLIGMNNNVRPYCFHNSNINVYERHLNKYKRNQYEFGRISN